MNAPDTDRREQGDDSFWPSSLREAENELRRIRRKAPKGETPPPAVGVGLSGGGIRSATFCLGAFQALSRRNLLPTIDYLSTVSGGGYFGSFLGRLFTRDEIKATDDVTATLNEPPLPRPGQAGLRGALSWLRENGRYLSPRGAGDLLLMLAGVVRNWVALQVTILSLVLLCAFVVVLARTGAELEWGHALPGLAKPLLVCAPWGLWLSPLWIVAAAIFVGFAFPAGWAYWFVNWPSPKSLSRRASESVLWSVIVIGPAFALGWWFYLTHAAAAQGPDRVVALDETLILFLVSAAAIVGAIRLWSFAAEALARRTRFKPSPIQLPPVLSVLTVVTVVIWLFLARARTAAWVGTAVVISVVTTWLVARYGIWKQADLADTDKDKKVRNNVYEDALARNRLTWWLKRTLVVTGVAAAVVLVDSLGESLYRAGHAPEGGWNGAGLGAVLSIFAAAAAPAAKMLPALIRPRKRRRGTAFLNPILAAVAAVVCGIVLVGSFWLAHAARWGFGTACASPDPSALFRLGISAAFCLLFALLFGATWTFLNNSSQLPFYKARLARAYLGASNSGRLAPPRGGHPDTGAVGQVVPGDDLGILEYFGVPRVLAKQPVPKDCTAFEHGSPLHLINTTINETKGGRSQIQQQDRKGLALCVGPCGMSAGVDDHVVFDREWKPDAGSCPKGGASGPWVRVRQSARGNDTAFLVEGSPDDARFSMEPLTLGHWTAISGAAFSTGTGYRTSFGLSFLAGFGNVRLGYWWDSRRTASRTGSVLIRILRRLFAVQSYLLQETFGLFPGTSRRHWYLSDGGHFENLGGYELIRRRLPLIVLFDAEADPDFEFGGLASLVRKARIDFGAEIRFLERAELKQRGMGDAAEVLGTLDELKRGKWRPDPGPSGSTDQAARTFTKSDSVRYSHAHAALAVVRYPDTDAPHLLLYVKASMTGDEPLDVRQYHREHEAFPHESTADQFFDEAQWESYRKLGEHVADEVLEAVAPLWNSAGPNLERTRF